MERKPSVGNSRSEDRQPPSVASEHDESPSVAEDSVAKKLADRAKKVSDDDDLPA